MKALCIQLLVLLNSKVKKNLLPSGLLFIWVRLGTTPPLTVTLMPRFAL